MAGQLSTSTPTSTHSFEGYSALEVLVSGPVTTLYCATQQLVGRKVVIKTLSSGILPDSAFGKNLEREASILGSLNHPNIVALHDLRHGQNAAWLVREWVPGWTVTELLRRLARLTPRLAVGIAIQLAHALAHAHGRGIVHRGLQPDCIVIGSSGEVKIVSFSRASGDRIARIPELIDVEPAADSSAYVAPEQLLGEAPDTRSDVYALGAVLWHMLTGRPPQRRELNPNAAPAFESQPQLFELVSRCLAQQSSERFADGRATVQALDEWLRKTGTNDGQTAVAQELQRLGLTVGGGSVAPSAAAPAPKLEGTQRQRKSRRLGLMLLGVSMLLALLAFAWRHAWMTRSSAQGTVANTGRAEVRVVVEPWARVYVDGQFFDVTPFANPIVLTPGTHQFQFEHPNAVTERRQVSIVAGESILLDVTMTIAARSTGLAESETQPRPPPSAREQGP